MLADRVRQRIHEALKETEIGPFLPADYHNIPLETPRNRDFGHYSTNLPFALKKELKRAPIDIAAQIAAVFPTDELFEKVEPAKPGFVNFRLSAASLREQVCEVRKADADFGRSDFGSGRRVQIEFVSANPTGPLSVGHGRLAAFGDALASVMSAAGFYVEKEFYINDVGNQIARLAASVEKRVRECIGETIEMCEDDYLGAYLKDVAAAILEKHGGQILEKPEEERLAVFAEDTITMMLEEQRIALKSFNVSFDVWFREHVLHDSGALGEALEILKKTPENIYENEGAIWFASTRYSDNEDRVLKKTSGPTTYFMADIAYIKNKFDRGFDSSIYIWGADHHGYIERMKSAAKALGYDPARLEILIVQLVRFKQGEEYVRMSKRKGNIVTLADLVDEIHVDVARFFFLMRTRDSHLEFDLQLASDKSEANPLFYLQYAHARVCSIIEKAAGKGLHPDDSMLDTLVFPAELNLIKSIADFPWEVQSAAESREPHRIITYLGELATEFHAFYHEHRVIREEEPEISSARLALCDAVRIVFRNNLNMLGLSAPEKM